MKIYKVKVNGKVYEVELEGVTESNKTIQTEPAKETKEQPKVENVKTSDGAPVLAPMAGTILDVKVSVGQKVKKGDTLMILEAMKLENEILAPQDGVVQSICVTKGQSVASKQELVILG